jgi:hypothetical protein
MIIPINNVTINVENIKKDLDIEIFTRIVINIEEQKCNCPTERNQCCIYRCFFFKFHLIFFL